MIASVQKIVDIQPIADADNIELAFVLGWQVVVKKGEFAVGDLVCYIQIDSVVPETPEFEFLRPRKFRVHTIKLRNKISQGLIIPLPIGKFSEGDDLTSIMGVTKYEKPDNNPSESQRIPKKGMARFWYMFKYNVVYKLFPFLKRKTRSPFPKHLVPITDEERIQNMPQVLTQYKGYDFIASYKLDGSSITIIHSKFLGRSSFRICSRRFELHDTKNDWHRVFNDTNFKNEVLKLVTYFNTPNIIVQGEAIGKFNGNHHNLKQNEIRLFNIFVNGKRIPPMDFVNVCNTLGIPHCPVYKVITLNHTMDEILKEAELKDPINPSTEAEGLVFRSIRLNMSFKVVNNKYLVKNKE